MLGIVLLCLPLQIFSQKLAFPEAEGFGKYAVGGRNGEIYSVTNLHDSGKGSFRDAVSRANRTVVFEVEGVIPIRSKIKVSDSITILGQSSPGEGITIYGNGVTFRGAKDVIVRYIRFRGSIGMSRGTVTVGIDYADNVILDHVSIEWGRWDNLHIQNSRNVTLQYCLIGDAIDPQRFGALLEGPTRLTIHHCLWINNKSRNPKAKGNMEFINNVIYNWGSNGFVGGHSAARHNQDLIGNYFIAGPNSSKNHYLSLFSETDHVFQKKNLADLNLDGKLNGKRISANDFRRTKATLVKKPSNVSYPRRNIEKPERAFYKILDSAGASKKRDRVDSLIIEDLRSLGLKGHIYEHGEKERF